MQRTTIFLDEELRRRLVRMAREQGVSFATLVREALAQYIAAPAAGGHMPSITGRFSSGTADTSSRVDELLWRNPHE
jgi:hypothetical protein